MSTERKPTDERASAVAPPDQNEPPDPNHEGATAFSVWLGSYLKVRRMSQRQLAERSGIDHSSISRLIRGGRMPSLRTAARLAKALGVSEPGVGEREPVELRTTRRPLDPIGNVERALRADDQMTEADIRRLMRQYLALRREGASRAGVAPRSTSRGDPVPLVAAVSRSNRPERPARTSATRGR